MNWLLTAVISAAIIVAVATIFYCGLVDAYVLFGVGSPLVQAPPEHAMRQGFNCLAASASGEVHV